MVKDVLTLAWGYMRRRKFGMAIKLLENKAEVYSGNFEYYLTLGIACLYVGEIGSARSYFEHTRKLNLTDSRLLLGQAAIFLRRGDTANALQYYMQVLDNDAENKVALDAIEFIRIKGDYDTICRWVDTGRIEQFYPPLGVNPDKVTAFIIPALAMVLGITLALVILPKHLSKPYQGQRMDISNLALTSEENANLQEKNLSTQAYLYILNDKQIKNSYSNALQYFQSHRDNMAQLEINRILNSNASLPVKQKAQVLMGYLESPTFDTLTDNPHYDEVQADPYLYLDCYVSWGGKITNAVVNNDGSYSCQLLVGYESGEVVIGIIPVKFPKSMNIALDQPVKILGQISLEDKKIYLKGKSVYQSVKDGLL